MRSNISTFAYVAGLIGLGSQATARSVNQVETKQSNCQDDGDRKRQRQRQKKESRSSTKSSTISPAQTRLAASVSDRYFSSILSLSRYLYAQAALAPLMCLASRRDSFQRTHWLQGWHSSTKPQGKARPGKGGLFCRAKSRQ
ncbi:hypothetical protein M431DRAFT_473783 [Trichoderma harzianum CBS 226.95]|uniref:Uncharacterized protein n=1 Tax=Trichoderma harzianum CBS 226.95 TaxID=983964 RepID=A0A2T4A7C0_TRIHA|nr:hypothetical protein M431DRAFT_473783 [Trichoderma harzianum CBS 226.95]PTB52883.1 hypothetical protein M431DRAFT_473783 [Trichoderma harzianum CBS 226.95]